MLAEEETVLVDSYGCCVVGFGVVGGGVNKSVLIGVGLLDYVLDR